MAQASIENPIINSAFKEPARHFATSDDGTVSGTKVDRRRPSEFFVPVARIKRGPLSRCLTSTAGRYGSRPTMW